jgi:hypothetical protein
LLLSHVLQNKCKAKLAASFIKGSRLRFPHQDRFKVYLHLQEDPNIAHNLNPLTPPNSYLIKTLYPSILIIKTGGSSVRNLLKASRPALSSTLAPPMISNTDLTSKVNSIGHNINPTICSRLQIPTWLNRIDLISMVLAQDAQSHRIANCSIQGRLEVALQTSQRSRIIRITKLIANISSHMQPPLSNKQTTSTGLLRSSSATPT